MSKPLDIAMEWDGQAEEAKLHIGGLELSGHPKDVDAIYCDLTRLRDDLQSAELRLEAIRERIYNEHSPLWRAVFGGAR